MKKKNQKLVALALAMSMAFGSALPAFAAENSQEGTGQGDGSVEGIVASDVFDVVLPAANDTFDFILDPQGLIKATGENNSKYEDVSFGDGNLFFQNDATNYSNISNSLTITNKSTMDVHVQLDATVTKLTVGDGEDAKSAVLTEDDGFESDTSASIYLALNTTVTTEYLDEAREDEETTVLTATGAQFKTTLDGANEGTYVVVYDDDKGQYNYVIDSDIAEGDFAEHFSSMEFTLTGACNPNGDWEGMSELAPEVKLTWYVGVEEKTKKFTVDFDLGEHGDSEAPSSLTNVVDGSTITEQKPADPTDSSGDWAFTGWYTDSDCTVPFDFDEGTITKDMTLYAGWSEVLKVPTIEDVEITSDATTVEITANLAGDAVAIGTVEYMFNGGTSFTTLTSASYLEIAGDTMTLKGTHVTGGTKLIGKGGGTYKVTFVDEEGQTVLGEDGEALTVTFQITVKSE